MFLKDDILSQGVILHFKALVHVLADLTNKEGTMFLEKSKKAKKLMMSNGKCLLNNNNNNNNNSSSSDVNELYINNSN